MDHLTRAFFDFAFRDAFRSKRGNEYQDWFSTVMEMCHPGDFIRVRPWGDEGDRKNDGYLRSERTLFQVYAPNAMTAKKAVDKIDEDFNGALPHWKEYFDVWVFTHNSWDGLGPDVTCKLLQLAHDHTPLRVTSWGFEELRRRAFRRLDEDDLCSLLGYPPTRQQFLDLGFQDLKPLLDGIARAKAPDNPDLRPVSPEKINENDLSEDVRILLRTGRTHVVEQMLTQWPEPTYGDEIAEAFRLEYGRLKAAGHTPDEIFDDLYVFAGGRQHQDAKHLTAVLSVLAYLFEQCDIFERPSQGVA